MRLPILFSAMARPFRRATVSGFQRLRTGAMPVAGALAVSLALATPAQANYVSGVLAYRDGQYDQALEAWSPLARKGIPAAQFSVGVMYYRGHGVQQDPVQAYVWFAKAAANGEPLAARMLGKLSAELSPQQLAQAQQVLQEGK